MIYISIVGHQIMAVINPLFSLPINDKNTVLLLSTGTRKSMANANMIAASLKKLNTVELHILEVSNSLVSDEAGNPPAYIVIEEIVKAHTDEEIFFNLAGGMNFQIAACSAMLSKYNHIKYLYPDIFGTQLYALDEHQKIFGSTRRITEIRHIFDLQGIPFHKPSDEPLHSYLQNMLATCGVDLPPNTEVNITVAGMFFDFVVNKANTLYFCKLIHNDNSNPSVFLADIRNIISKAINRKDFEELFHHRILVLTNSALAVERFQTESLGKITVALYKKKGRSMQTDQQEILRRFLVNQPAILDEYVFKPAHQVSCGKGKTLYTFLGREPLPTLMAIWSHKAARTCLFYTPQDKRIEFYRERLLSCKRRLPTEEVECIPVSFHARELEDLHLPPEEKFEVNVTPGTKSHSFFLTRLAQRYGGKIMSINTGSGKIEDVVNGKSFELLTPPLDLFLSLTLDSRKIDYGADKKAITRKQNELGALLNFFREIHRQHQKIDDFFGPELQLTGIHMMRFKNSFNLQFVPPDAARRPARPLTYTYSTEPNRWFEELVAYVLTQCGANEIRLAVKTQWESSTAFYGSHRTENDICARIGDSFYVISCKAGNKLSINKTTLEVRSTTASIGRFAIPLLAVLKYAGSPKMVQDVWVFGYKTFTDKNAMHQLLLTARDANKTTQYRLP